MVQQPNTKRFCSSCDRSEPDAEFYAVGAECKGCKRARSRRNRRLQARKLVIAERLIDVLATLASPTVEAPDYAEEAS